jgi:hypothetical protein
MLLFSYNILFSLLECQLLATFDVSYSGVLPTWYLDMFSIIAYEPHVLTTILTIRHLHVMNVSSPFSAQ